MPRGSIAACVPPGRMLVVLRRPREMRGCRDTVLVRTSEPNGDMPQAILRASLGAHRTATHDATGWECVHDILFSALSELRG